MGRAEGEAKGRAESKAEMALSMLKENEPLDKIMRFTGLSESALIALKNNS
jgi:hypothetical protein